MHGDSEYLGPPPHPAKPVCHHTVENDNFEILQQIGAGGFIQLPSTIEEVNGSLSVLIHKYFRGAKVDAESRIRLFKLTWDLIGSPLASRHELYERFYTYRRLIFRKIA